MRKIASIAGTASVVSIILLCYFSSPFGAPISSCNKMTLQDSAFAFKLRIRTTTGYFQVNVGTGPSQGGCPDYRVDFVGKHVVQGDSLTWSTLRDEACYVLGNSNGDKREFIVEWNVIVPFVPDTGLSFKVATGSSGTVELSILDFNNVVFLDQSFTNNGTLKAARNKLPPQGGLKSIVGAKPVVKPMMGAYMFPWYGLQSGPTKMLEHWDSTMLYTPLGGWYDSGDTTVIRRQMNYAQQANLDLFVLSYWDQEYSNKNTAPFVKIAETCGMSISAMIETSVRRTGVAPRDCFLAQIQEILANYATSPAWLKADGKPVIFFYDRIVEEFQSVSDSAWWGDLQWVKTQLGTNVILMFPATKPVTPAQIQVMGGGFSFAANSGASNSNFWVGAYQDDWNWIWTITQGNGISALPILPGFKRLRIPSDGPNYINQWRAAQSSMPDMIIVNSWNEYHESSVIEPTTAFGTQYIDLTAQAAGLFCNGKLGPQLDTNNMVVHGYDRPGQSGRGPLPHDLISVGNTFVVRNGSGNGSSLEIFNLSGTLIRTLLINKSEAYWDGLDRRGARVPSGVYLVKCGALSLPIVKKE
jgi:hypothetical protein